MKIASVIKFEGDRDTIVWKHPEEDFNSASELIVHESQEAIFIKNGRVCDVFSAGRYKLTTENLPILSKLMRIPFGGKNPFHCEVYFVNKAFVMDVLWGTKQPMDYEDVKYHVILPIGASGQMAVQIENASMFVNLLVGTTNSFTKTDLINYFRSIVNSCLKDNLAKIMERKQISVFKVNSSIEEISQTIQATLDKKLKTYGVSMVNFAIEHIQVPEDDPTFVKLKQALAKRGEMDILGYSYEQERKFDVLGKAVENQGVAQSTMMNAGVGLGLGFGVGGAVGDMARTLQSNTQNPVQQSAPPTQPRQSQSEQPKQPQQPTKTTSTKIKCPKCGSMVSKGKFCLNCGATLINQCKKCKALIPTNSKFCPSCGEKIGE